MTFQVHDDVSRRAARKLLRQRGLPTSEVHRMSYAALAQALENQCDPSLQATFDALVSTWRATPPPWKGGNGSAVPAPIPSAVETGPAPVAVAGGVDAAIAALVAAVAPKGPAIDMDAVRSMVEAAVSDAVRDRIPQTVKVECKGIVRDVPGVKHERFGLIAKALGAGCHVWLPGPAGSGKSTVARQALESLGYDESRIHMTGAIETPFQLVGYVSPNGDDRTLRTPFRKAWETGGAFIFDDVDRSNPKALAAFNEALANGHCAFPDGVIKAHADFLCIATANTYGLGGGSDYVGAARLDKATLDRFVYIEVPYDEKSERAIAAGMGDVAVEWCAAVQRVRSAVRRLGLKHLVTPRATYKGARLLAAGLSQRDVEAATVYAGLDAETVSRVKGAL